MKTWSYLLAPFAAWLAAGCLKFAINSLRAGKPAFGLIGYGGMPSNHSAIVSSMAALTALREGWTARPSAWRSRWPSSSCSTPPACAARWAATRRR